jgi:hypothetical protein
MANPLIRQLESLGVGVGEWDPDYQGRHIYFPDRDRETLPHDEICRLVSQLPDVRVIDFGVGVTDEGLEWFLRNKATAERLVRLDFVNTKVTAKGLRRLAEATRLPYLIHCLEESPDAELEAICQIKTLRRLGLVGSQMSDVSLEHMAKLESLEKVNLSHCPNLNMGVKVFRQMPRLKEVSLGNTGLTDEGAEELARATHLEKVSFGDTAVTDRGLSAVAKMPHLKTLLLERLKVTNAGLAAVTRCSTLETLMWVEMPLDSESLLLLSHMKSLETLYYTRELAPADAEEVLNSGLPDIELIVLELPEPDEPE